MKRKIITPLYLLLAAILLSCGGGEASKSSSKLSKDDAQAIIAYTNDVMAYLEAIRAGQESYFGSYEIFNTSRMDPKRPIFPLQQMRLTLLDMKYNKVKVTPKVVEPYQSEMQSAIEQVYSSANQMMETTIKLSSHIKAEDYKSDDFKTVDELQAKVEMMSDSIYGIQNRIYAMIDDVAGKAEIVQMQEHPYGQQILAAKANLKVIDETMEYLQEFNPKMGVDSLQKLYTTLETTNKKAINIDHAPLKEYSKEKAYDNFCKGQIENNFMPELRKFIRNVETNDEVISRYFDREIDRLFTKYEQTINSYNVFVS